MHGKCERTSCPHKHIAFSPGQAWALKSLLENPKPNNPRNGRGRQNSPAPSPSSRSVQSKGKFGTMCVGFAAGRGCTYGDKCFFLHQDTQAELDRSTAARARGGNSRTGGRTSAPVSSSSAPQPVPTGQVSGAAASSRSSWAGPRGLALPTAAVAVRSCSSCPYTDVRAGNPGIVSTRIEPGALVPGRFPPLTADMPVQNRHTRAAARAASASDAKVFGRPRGRWLKTPEERLAAHTAMGSA